jgi:hypothetical protein
MSNFITIAEVKSIGFARTIADALIPEKFIVLAEHAHLRPALGDDFFDSLDKASGFTATETALMLLIKDALAFWVKYELLPHIAVQVTNGGIKLSESNNSTNASASMMRETRKAALETGRKLWKIAERYIVDNASDLPNYEAGNSLTTSTAGNDGGFIIPST